MKFSAIILILLSGFSFALAAYNLFAVYNHPIRFRNEIIASANESKLSPALVASIINVESSFRHDARSNKDAIGLMQIKLSTANYIGTLNKKNELSEEGLFDPATNIAFGCQYLRYLINKFNNLNSALAAYNAGETRVKSWLNSGIYSTDGKILNYIPFKETRNYVEKINSNIKYYKKLF